MSPDDIDQAMRAAVDERLTARIDQAAQKRDARRRRLAELSERRRHGLTARHAGKLNRLAARGESGPPAA